MENNNLKFKSNLSCIYYDRKKYGDEVDIWRESYHHAAIYHSPTVFNISACLCSAACVFIGRPVQ